MSDSCSVASKLRRRMRPVMYPPIMKADTCTHTTQMAKAMAIQNSETPSRPKGLVRLSPIAEPKVSMTSEIAAAATAPARIAGQST
jgi:hypothetical protein